ncbi:MAG: ATP-grasp domain-containing protein [Deltaproteobacteria bacterium]|nr:ATP-grasp domain-containing protein [Deltaproteobacteria bacterium]
MFRKILIANRGEIAVRIIRTCRDMGIRTAVIHSAIDANALHVRLADESHEIDDAAPLASYLNMNKILETAENCGAEAIHPGYGFLAENPDFVDMCEQRGIPFIGPPSKCMYKAKPKHRAKQLMKMFNIPVTPGSDDAIQNGNNGLKQACEIADEIGYPVVVKPSGTGGGIGIRMANDPKELERAINFAKARGRSAFGTSAFYIEKYLTGVKHIEFQVLADRQGNVIHLGDRDCSVQRRYQKLVEECPAPTMTPFLRMKMGAAAIDVAMILQYVNALTVEFFYFPETRQFYFNEINSRLQVEHCVTELAVGIDLVREQIRIAAGESLQFSQDDIQVRNHALECRITAEDPARNFIPSPGVIRKLHIPHGPGIRIDEGIYEGYDVPIYYDSLLMKVISWSRKREESIALMKRALRELRIEGIHTSIPFHRALLEDEDFVCGKHTTDLINKKALIRKYGQPDIQDASERMAQ